MSGNGSALCPASVFSPTVQMTSCSNSLHPVRGQVYNQRVLAQTFACWAWECRTIASTRSSCLATFIQLVADVHVFPSLSRKSFSFTPSYIFTCSRQSLAVHVKNGRILTGSPWLRMDWCFGGVSHPRRVSQLKNCKVKSRLYCVCCTQGRLASHKKNFARQ